MAVVGLVAVVAIGSVVGLYIAKFRNTPQPVSAETPDEITPVKGSEMVIEKASSRDKTLRLFDGLYHETMNEPEQDEVLDLVVGWLDERT